MTTIKIDNMTENEIFDAMVAAYYESEGRFAVALSDGCTAIITAFSFMPNHEDCQWFFIAGIADPWADEDSLAKVAHYFTQYDARREEIEKGKAELAAFKAELDRMDENTYEYIEMCGRYSNWHKDLYGCRPHFD